MTLKIGFHCMLACDSTPPSAGLRVPLNQPLSLEKALGSQPWKPGGGGEVLLTPGAWRLERLLATSGPDSCAVAFSYMLKGYFFSFLFPQTWNQYFGSEGGCGAGGRVTGERSRHATAKATLPSRQTEPSRLIQHNVAAEEILPRP